MTLSSGETVTGVQTVGAYLSRIWAQKLLGRSALERAQVNQWMEYSQLHLQSSLNDGSLFKGALSVSIFPCNVAFKLVFEKYP